MYCQIVNAVIVVPYSGLFCLKVDILDLLAAHPS